MNSFTLNSLSTSRKILIKIALMLIYMDEMCQSGIANTALGALTEAFPDAGPTQISMIATIVTLVMIPFGLIAGWLVRHRMNKKDLALIGYAFLVVGGFMPFFANTIGVILFWRALLGVGAGLINPLSMSMIRDLYDGKERASMIGYAQAVGSAFMIVISILTGVLTTMNWHYTFISYLILIIAPVFMILFVPREPFDPVKKDSAAVVQKPKEKIPGLVFGIAAVLIVYGIALSFIFLKLAIYVMEENLGTPAFVGSVMSLQTVGMIIASVLFGTIYAKLKGGTLVMGLVGLIVCYLALYAYPSATVVAVVCFLFGFVFSNVQPFIFTFVSAIVPKTQATLAVSICQTGLMLANFLASFLTAIILLVMPEATTRQQFIVPAFMFVVLAVVAIVFAIKTKDSPAYKARTEIEDETESPAVDAE